MLPREYPELDHRDVRIVLVEGTDRVLPSFTPRLSAYAQRTLERLGVEVRCNSLVASADERSVTLVDGTHIPTYSMVWAAGVRPADPLDDPSDTPSGRIDVDDHLRVVGADDVYAIGDVAAGPRPARARRCRCSRHRQCRKGGTSRARSSKVRRAKPFRYRNRGSLATIGRSAAVGKIGPLQFTGFLGWVVWLTVHLYYLIGFGNRVRVLARWAWYYFAPRTRPSASSPAPTTAPENRVRRSGRVRRRGRGRRRCPRAAGGGSRASGPASAASIFSRTLPYRQIGCG